MKTKRKTRIIISAAVLIAVTIFIYAFYAFNPVLVAENNAVGTDVEFGSEAFVAYTKDTSLGLEIYNSPNVRLTAETVEAEESLSKSASRVIELTAEIFPSYAKNKSVDWSVDWVESPQIDGAAYNFVAVEPLSDGSTTARIYAEKSFRHKIKVTVTSRDNPEATAYCIVDYGARFATGTGFEDKVQLKCDASFALKTNYLHYDRTTTSEPLPLEFDEEYLSYYPYDREISVFVLYEYHTVGSSFENFVMKVKPSDEFYNSLKAKGLAKETNEWTVIGSEGKAIVEEVYNGLCNQDVISSDYESVNFDLCNLFNSAIAEASFVTHDFVIFLSCENDFDYREYLFYVKFDRDSDVFEAIDVELNEENILL